MKRLCVTLLVLVAGGVIIGIAATAAPADQPGRVVAVTAKLKLQPGKGQSASLVVTPGVTTLIATVGGEIASVSAGACPAKAASSASISVPVAMSTDGAPALIDLCVTGKKDGETQLVVAGDDGSSAVLPVAVTTKAASVTAPAPPPTLQVITNEDTAEETIQPGFALASTLSAIAAGPDGSGTAYLSTNQLDCPDHAATTSTTTTSTTAALTTTPVRLLVCGTSQVGTYTAKFDVNGDTSGGELSVSAIRRRPALLAALVALAGLLVALLFGWLINKATSSAKQTAREERRESTVTTFDFIAAELTYGGPRLSQATDIWAPQRWPALAAGSSSADPTPEAAVRPVRTGRGLRAPIGQALGPLARPPNRRPPGRRLPAREVRFHGPHIRHRSPREL